MTSPGGHTVIAVNYHRIGDVDAANPLHRLHTVAADVFTAHLDHMQTTGAVVSVDDVRHCRGLADTNYVVSFDDVPSSAMAGIQMMLDRRLPVTVSVCTQLASTGWGTRDKVYCIDRFADPDTVTAAARAAFPDAAPGGEPVSFYHLTKRDDLDPDQVLTTLIDPLFRRVEHLARPFLDGSGYLPWPTLRELAGHPLVTIANHTASHANLTALSTDRLATEITTEIAREITTAHDQIVEVLGVRPRYLTVPFGRLHQRVALDCLDVVDPLDYHGILWVGEAATLITAPYRAQVLHLNRLHAPTTADEFVTRTRAVSKQPVCAAIWRLPTRAHTEPVEIVESSDPHPATRFESLARQGKDYASSRGFYRYQFTTNPAKGSRPDYYAVRRGGRIEATAYNFHAAFRIGAVTVPGVYLASWRKLPEAHRTAAGALVHRMTAREAVVGVHHPSSIAAPAFSNWHPIPVWRLRITVTHTAPVTHTASSAGAVRSPHSDRSAAGASAADVRAEPDQVREPAAIHHTVHDTVNDTVVRLIDALMGDTDFTLARSVDFYRWRHETYPLASCRHLVLYRGGEPVAYAVTLHRADRIEIADWYATTNHDYTRLLATVYDHARTTGVSTIEVETSDHALARDLAAQFTAAATSATNFYHVNRARLAEFGVTGNDVDDLAARWPHLRFHESATTGDVLIR